jgi:hypothetical protein
MRQESIPDAEIPTNAQRYVSGDLAPIVQDVRDAAG